jgi:hypothetical protein
MWELFVYQVINTQGLKSLSIIDQDAEINSPLGREISGFNLTLIAAVSLF